MTATLNAFLDLEPKRTTQPETLRAWATLVNHGPAALSVVVTPMMFSALALEVTDADGTTVPPLPPPVPGGPMESLRLEPGQSHRLDYPGFLPAWTPKGSYRVRFYYIYRPVSPPPGTWTGVVSSPWVEFDIIA